MNYENLKQSLVDCVKEMGSQYQKTVDGANEFVDSVRDSDKIKKTLDTVEKTSESFLKEIEGVGVVLRNAFAEGMKERKGKKQTDGVDEAPVKDSSTSEK